MNSLRENRWFILAVVSIAKLFALSLWFSASAIVPQLKVEWNISDFWAAWLTSSVQLGFVIGAILSSIFAIADRYNARHLFAISAVLGALANALFSITDNITQGIALRFLTGFFLAGVYPVAVKIISLWFKTHRGISMGVLIGALTLGSSMPHLISTYSVTYDWRLVILISSALSLVAAIIMYWVVPDAKETVKAVKHSFSIKILKGVFKNRPVMLANYGYIGHMWELYAMWTWIPVFLYESMYHIYGANQTLQVSSIFSFIIIGGGGVIGCILGGWLSDRMGRTYLTSASMLVSGLCSIVIGFTFQIELYWLTFFIAFIWGSSIIADSAQFSAAVTELANSEYVGTALTLQMALGFLITIISINLIPLLVQYVGWEWAFLVLSLGPFLGVVAMFLLRENDASLKMSLGKR